MKSVGKQLEEARLAKNWTPELAARETKIKVDRVRDLECDDYSNFSSPTYARGFVRTYARALSLDEYKILRQLDNKLPEDDNASFVNDNGLPYVPETSKGNHIKSANRTGLYVVGALGFVVMFVAAFVLLQAYRAGELPRYFANGSESATNAAPMAAAAVDSEGPKPALPVDPNDTAHSIRALPVDLNNVNATAVAPDAATTPAAAPASADAVIPVAPIAKAADVADASAASVVAPAPAVVAVAAPPPGPAASTNAAPAAVVVPEVIAGASTPPPAAPVNPTPTVAENSPAPTAVAVPTDTLAPPADSTTPAPVPNESSKNHRMFTTPATERSLAPLPPSDTAAAPEQTTPPVAAPPDGLVSLSVKTPPRALPVDPNELAGAANASAPSVAPASSGPSPGAAPGAAPDVVPAALNDNSPAGKRLILTASQNSSVRVTLLNGPQGSRVLYDSILRSGQSLSFDGRRFSVNVGIPSAVAITLDGVNYGPHSERQTPETFTLESHQP